MSWSGTKDPIPADSWRRVADISEGFGRLIAANRLKLPSRHRMLSLWQDLFFHDISPEALLVELAGGLQWFSHSKVLLLFGKARAIYDCQIRRANEAIGHITLVLYRERDRVVPFLPFPTRPGHRVNMGLRGNGVRRPIPERRGNFSGA